MPYGERNSFSSSITRKTLRSWSRLTIESKRRSAFPGVPLHASFEIGQTIEQLRFERFDGEQRNQTDHRADLHRKRSSFRQVQDVIEEAVLLVPQSDFVVAAIVHCVCDVEKMFPELARDVFIRRIFFRELHRDGEKI